MEIGQELNRYKKEIAALEQQVAVMRQRLEMKVTEHSRTSFDLRRKNEMMQVHILLYRFRSLRLPPRVFIVYHLFDLDLLVLTPLHTACTAPLAKGKPSGRTRAIAVQNRHRDCVGWSRS